jgi:hypothetical protein
MPCRPLMQGDKQVGFICGRGLKPPKCKWCEKPSTKLCDYPVTQDRTCDAPMCNEHAKSQAANIDTCPSHPEMRYF